MDFDFNDDQEMLRDTVRKWVEKAYTFERRREIVKAGGFSKEAWANLAELGLTGLYVPEAQGGMGFGPVDAMVVMEELGRGIVMEPYAAVALVAASLLTAGKAPSAALWLQGIAEGKERVVLAHQERKARYRLAHVETVALDDVPAAGGPFIAQRFKRHHLVHRAIQLDIVEVYDGGQAGEAILGGGDSPFPDQASLAFAIAKQDDGAGG